MSVSRSTTPPSIPELLTFTSAWTLTLLALMPYTVARAVVEEGSRLLTVAALLPEVMLPVPPAHDSPRGVLVGTVKVSAKGKLAVWKS